MLSLNVFNLPIPSSRNMALGLTQPLTEMSTRNLPEVKWPTLKANNIPPSENRISGKCGSLDVLEAYGPPRPVTGIALLFYYDYML
jgi:hypothetical protein